MEILILYKFFFSCSYFLPKQRSIKEIVDLICWVDMFQNFRFKFDISWFALWSLAQNEVLNLLHTYVVVLTLGTHNRCNRSYLLHIWLCFGLVLKPGINNPHHEKGTFWVYLFVCYRTPFPQTFLWLLCLASEKVSII